jgi:hypothetical protein
VLGTLKFLVVLDDVLNGKDELILLNFHRAVENLINAGMIAVTSTGNDWVMVCPTPSHIVQMEDGLTVNMLSR